MNSHSDALFGAVAVELNVIDVPRLATALRECGLKNETLLPEFLLKRQWMTPEQRRAVDARVNQLQAERRDDAAAESSGGAESEVDAAPGDEVDVRFHRTVLFSEAHVEGNGTTVDFKSISRSKYTLTRVHGMGGLGRVWLARDRQLQREVALKELVSDKAGDHGAKARLIQEAQVTGQLEHPNIVPVYDLDEGAAEDGPFYTMKFLRGETLKDAIDRYHKPGERSSQGFPKIPGNSRRDRMELRRLLQAFVGICHAIAYAHSRGVVHRDLKPSNIVLGDFGEVIVIDWGLACVVKEAAEGGQATTGVSETPGVAGPSDERASEEGKVIGTPAYMAPEQADGRQTLVNRSTDIYGLGGVLFEILTGRPPHLMPRSQAGAWERGSSLQDTMNLLKQISAGPTPRVRAVASTVAAPLDAICAKAMAREQAARYTTAGELADDVQRWLADEPVAVYREPWHDRLFRWLRRRRAAVIAGGWALVAVAVASTVAAIVTNEARRKEAAAKQRAEESLAAEQTALAGERAARAEAVERFREARRAVDRSVTGVSDVLEFYPGVQKLRAILLKKAADDYERFAREKSDDPELLAETGRAWIRLGDVRRLLNDWNNAQTAYRRAITLFEELDGKLSHAGEVRDRRSEVGGRNGEHVGKRSDLRPPTSDFRYAARIEAANARGRLALALAAAGKDADAKTEQKRALDDLAGLAGDVKDNPELQLAEAAAMLGYARLLAAAGERREAIDRLTAAEVKFQRLDVGKGDPRYAAGLAAARNELGVLLHAAGRHREAVEKLHAAITGYHRLTLKEPNNIDYARRLAGARLNLANAMRVTGRDELNLKVYRDLVAEYVVQFRAQPELPVHRENIAATRTNVAEVLRRLGRCGESVEEAAAAIRLYDDLVREHATIARYHFGKASALHVLGLTLRDLGKDGDAADALQQAEKTFSELVQLNARHIPFLREHAACLYAIATLAHRQGHLAPARKRLDQSIAVGEAALKIDRDDPASRDGLARGLFALGEVQFEQKQLPAAAESFRRCREIRNTLRSAPEHVHSLAWLLVHCRDLRQRDPQLAVELAGGLTKSVRDSPRYWNLLGAAHLRAGDAQASVAALRQAIKLRQSRNAFDWFLLAMAQQSLRDSKQALASFQTADKTMRANRPGHPELQRLRSEAAAALGLPRKPAAPVPAPRP